MIFPAIYSKKPYDPLFHASMSCRKATITKERSMGLTKDAENYHVSTMHMAISQGKYPCDECWVSGGYQAMHDPAAAL